MSNSLPPGRFSQSTWQGQLLSPEDLLRANPEACRSRAARAGARRGAGLLQRRRSAREIEQAVLRDHPGLFPRRGNLALRLPGAGADAE
jgi:protein arginine N-methyltransferase 1